MGKIIGLVVVVVFLVGGLLYWNGRQSDPRAVMVQSDDVPVAQDSGTGIVAPQRGVVSSIKEAMGLGQKMQCTYTVGEGNAAVQSVVAIEGQRFKSTTVMGGMTAYALFDGEQQYSWTSATKTGMKMDKACLDELKTLGDKMGQADRTATTPAPEDAAKVFDAAKNLNCSPAGDVDFTLPKDVTFADGCALMRQGKEMMEQFKDKLPAGMTVPNIPTQQ